MKYIIALIAAFFAVVLASSAMPYLKILGVSPDLPLIFVACWAVIRGQKEAMVVVPLAGLTRDLLTSDPVGASVLALAPIVFLASVREMRIVESDFVMALGVVAVASLAFGILHMGVLTVTGDSVPWFTGLLRVTLPLMLVNPLFAVIVYPPMRWLSPTPRSTGVGVGSAVQL